MKSVFKKLNTIFFILSIVLISPILYFLVFLRKNKQKDSEATVLKPPLKILVIPQLTRIGDIVCSTPIFRSIKLHYPESFISVLGSQKAMGIIAHNQRIDEIIDFNAYNLWTLAKKLREEKFDWSFCLSGVSIFSALVLLSLIPKRVKITRRNRPVTEILTDWMSSYQFLYEDHTFLPAHYLKLLEPLSIRNQEVVKEVFTNLVSDKKVSDFFVHNSIDENVFLLGISVTAGNKIKEWGDDKFAELAKRIVDIYREKNIKVLFIGSQKDESRILNIIKKVEDTSFAGRFVPATNFFIEDLPSLMSRLNLFIAVDTGPIYIAHSLKIPLIDITGPVDPLEQPPQDKLSILVTPPKGISPSSFVFKKPGKSTTHKIATDSIDVKDVLAAVEMLMERVYRNVV